MAVIIVVEDEELLRRSIAQGLSRMKGVEVFDAGTVDEALGWIDQTRPDLIFSDIDLPGRSGIELIGELGKRNLRIPVIFLSAYVQAYRAQIPLHANVEILQKPVGISYLRELVKERLSETETFSSTSPFTVADYLQLACLGNHSVTIEVTRKDDTLAQVEVVSGQLWSAFDAQGKGEEAFYRIMALTGVPVACHAFERNPGEQTIFKPWESLLIDAARIQDESSRHREDAEIAIQGAQDDVFSDLSAELDACVEETDAEGVSPFMIDDPDDVGLELADSAEPPTEAADAEGQFNRAMEKGLDALLSKDYEAAVAAFREAAQSRPDDGRVRANLQRLKDLGWMRE